MGLRVLDAVELPIRYEANIAEVRRSARALAQSRGFDSFGNSATTRWPRGDNCIVTHASGAARP